MGVDVAPPSYTEGLGVALTPGEGDSVAGSGVAVAVAAPNIGEGLVRQIGLVLAISDLIWIDCPVVTPSIDGTFHPLNNSC